ncbi:S8 family serine peptidase [Silvanigrella aquatica]|uniref:Peptidase S8/S53 domain-containing protein n=1 Tax=Silvanigrella aquatica TaxID=1915309 RepID=A0A1L4CXE2_9BACT|nr:S8 family serine peptidase [Silvanigrella aquatica]APJ02614.1 hypothetical protein AXG55_01160 [Silvanigrella aquatica]
MKAKSIIKFLFISLIFLNCSRNNKINNYGNTGLSPDILFNQQWYLKNTGQMTYFNLRVKNGIDLNISYPQIYTGQGVKAIVADDGVYFDHPNLAPNLLANFSLDFSDSSLGKIPVNKPEIKDKINDTHGTFVAGILGGSHSQKKWIPWSRTKRKYSFCKSFISSNRP